MTVRDCVRRRERLAGTLRHGTPRAGRLSGRPQLYVVGPELVGHLHCVPDAAQDSTDKFPPGQREQVVIVFP
jgi:hypothetical protein